MGEGKGGMIWENSIEAHILPYVKQMTSPSSMNEAGHSKLVHWDNPEDNPRRREVGGGSGWEQMYTHGWFMSMYGKNHYNIIK